MLAMSIDEKTRNGLVTKLMRKLQARDRLQTMADAVRQQAPDPAGREIERLKEYLSEWVEWQRGYFPPHLTGGHGAAWVSAQSNATSASEYLERADRWAMETLHGCIEEGLAMYPEGVQLRAALRLRWLNETIAAVFRSNRFDLDEMADRAERALVELVKRRGLPL